MKRNERKLLIPAVLAVSAGCTPPTPTQDAGTDAGTDAGLPCGTYTYQACWPDGGYACPSDCSGQKLADGGLDLDDAGMPKCFC